MTDPDRIAVQLGRALTGEELALHSSQPETLARELEELGWDAQRLAEFRRGCQAAGKPWPLPVQREALVDVGFAVFHAKLTQLRKCLGLTGLQPNTLAQRPWNADERRLAADRPPHWG